MSILIKILLGLVVLVVIAGIAIRLMPVNETPYKMPPQAIKSDGKPHEYRLIGDNAPIFNQPLADVMALVDAVILDQPRTTRVAAHPENLHVTYRQTSFLMGYPDYISISFEAISEGKTRMNILSRSHYGHSDLGANEKRVEAWLDQIEARMSLN